MIRLSGKVWFLDGTIEEIHALPVDVSYWERYAARNDLAKPGGAPAITSSMVTCYSALRRTKRLEPEGIGVEPWMETVEWCELEAIEQANPTNPEASDGSTRSSPSQPESPLAHSGMNHPRT